MGTYLDFTGTNPDYRISHRTVAYTLPGNVDFIVPLKRPAYMESLKVYYSDIFPLVELNAGMDYVIRESDIDYAAVGAAKVNNREFNKTLIKSVTLLIKPPEDVELTIEYNTLEMSYITYNSLDREQIDFTPEYVKELNNTIAYLRDTRNPIENLIADSVAVSPTLDVDYTGESPANLISGEIHNVNSQNGKIFIRPAAGSFYKTGVIIRNVSNNAILTAGTDYRIISHNPVKTSQTSNVGGVYDVIAITVGLVGSVSVTYQAFGGDVSKRDVDNMFSVLINVIKYINNASFLSSNTVGTAPAIIQLIDRIQNLEDTVRILSTGGAPTYADSTNNKAFKHKFQSPDSINKHWYTIARLYKVAGSTEVFTRSQCRYKIMGALSGLMFDVVISVDIKNPKPITMNVLASNDVMRYIPYTQYSDIGNRIQPEFRIIWNEEVGVQSGILLQIGFNLKQIAIETLAIEDLSGSESCWIAQTADVLAVAPKDDLVTLPNGTSIWSSGSAASKSAVATYTPNRGYLAWLGTLNLDNIFNTPTALSSGLISPVDITISNISKVNFHIWDRLNGKMIIASSNVVAFNSKINCATTFYPNDFCSIDFTLTQVGNSFNMSAYSILGNYSRENDLFELREITFEF